MHYGDSQIENDRVTGRLRERLQNDFGGLDIQKTEKYDDFYGMSYDQLIAPLIKAIQEQQTIIDDLKSRIETLEG